MRFSVITPIYNAEQFLPSCIESVLQQNNQDYEMILIDDGSTDSSKSICMEYSGKNEKIRYFCQENMGPSAARNRGLRAARGDYIVFLDADDMLDGECLRAFERIIQENGAEVIIGGCKGATSLMRPSEFNRGKHDAISQICKNRFSLATWKVIARRELFLDNQILFPEDCRLGEDVFVMTQIVGRCKNIYLCEKPHYFYNEQNNLSITHTISFPKIWKTTELCETMDILAKGEDEEVQQLYFTEMSLILINLGVHYWDFSKEEKRRVRAWMRKNQKVLIRVNKSFLPTRVVGRIIGQGNSILVAGAAVRIASD